MRARLPYVLRAATIVVFVLAIALAVRLAFDSGDASDKPEVAAVAPGTVSVTDAISGAHAPSQTLAVRGFLFEGGGTGVRLCPRRKPTKPPICLGPFLDVYHLDLHGLPLRRSESFGRPMRWLAQPVTVYGTVVGTALNATGVSR